MQTSSSCTSPERTSVGRWLSMYLENIIFCQIQPSSVDFLFQTRGTGCPSRSTICLTLPVLCLKREKNTANQGHTLNISMECVIASAASIIPWSDDFQWFLILESKLWGSGGGVWVFCHISAAIFFSTKPGLQSVVFITSLAFFFFFARCVVLHLVLAQPWR